MDDSQSSSINGKIKLLEIIKQIDEKTTYLEKQYLQKEFERLK